MLVLAGVPRLSSQDVKVADRKTYNEAMTHYDNNDFRQAATLLRKVASRNPQSADVQFWLGMTAVNDGYKAAGIRRYFSRCIQLAPDYPHPLAHFYMGIIHYTDDQYDAAVTELNTYFAMAEGSNDRTVNAAYEEASNYLYWSQFLAEAQLNAAPFEPRRVAGASSAHDEMLPFITFDGSECYYLRRLPVKKGQSFYARELEETTWKLCSSRLHDTVFSNGTPLPPPFNSGRPEGGVSITADGKELYLPIITDNRGYANSDIYRATLREGRWQDLQPLEPAINNPNSWESQPAISADGNTLIFASNRQGGHGGTDLWQCHKLSSGGWSRPENMGTGINTAGNEKMPFLAADGHTLYFLSDGWQGFGGYDIYFANLNDRHGNRPTNLGLPINTEDDESRLVVSTDGRHAFFSGRTDNSRSADILVFDLYPAARPEPMQIRRLTINAGSTSSDTTLILNESHPSVVTLSLPGMLPVILNTTPHRLPQNVSLNDSIAAIDLADPMVVEALATWLIDNPRVHLLLESRNKTIASEACNTLRNRGIRPDRIAYRGGTDVVHNQIRLQ